MEERKTCQIQKGGNNIEWSAISRIFLQFPVSWHCCARSVNYETNRILPCIGVIGLQNAVFDFLLSPVLQICIHPCATCEMLTLASTAILKLVCWSQHRRFNTKLPHRSISCLSFRLWNVTLIFSAWVLPRQRKLTLHFGDGGSSAPRIVCEVRMNHGVK